MERASEVNRNFGELIFPKTFRLPHNLTQILVDYFIWKTNNHTLFKRNYISYNSLVKCCVLFFNFLTKNNNPQSKCDVKCVYGLNVITDHL